MEREKKNPFVTRIELAETKRELNEYIVTVDRKVDNNHAEVSKWFELSRATSENIVKSNSQMLAMFKELSSDLKDISKSNYKNFEDLTLKVSEHDLKLFEHNQYIEQQKDIVENKRTQLIKWVAALSGIFVAILAGVFGVVEVLIPYLFGAE